MRGQLLPTWTNWSTLLNLLQKIWTGWESILPVASERAYIERKQGELLVEVSDSPSVLFFSCSHVCVALSVTEKLLAECEQRHLQLIADSYLDMLHVMLESPQSKLRIMATNSVRNDRICLG